VSDIPDIDLVNRIKAKFWTLIRTKQARLNPYCDVNFVGKSIQWSGTGHKPIALPPSRSRRGVGTSGFGTKRRAATDLDKFMQAFRVQVTGCNKRRLMSSTSH
jgi:hypothetical protein